MTVNDGVTLTLTPGTIVKFALNVQLTVYGTLDANGAETEEDWVVFTSLKDDEYGGDTDGVEEVPGPGDWRGIYLYGVSTNDGIGEFDYCRIRYGGDPASIDANVYFYYSDSGHFADSISEYSETDGLRISSCSPEITDSAFFSNSGCGINSSAPKIGLGNNLIYENGLDGIKLTGVADIVNNTIISNGDDGINCSGGNDVVIANNIIVSNLQYGISCSTNPMPDIFNNNVWDNTVGDYYTCEAGAGDISEDPLFVDLENHDFHLTDVSLCMDTGSNCAPVVDVRDKDDKPRFLDGDDNGTTIVDMGAYEFGDADNCTGDVDDDGDVDGDDLASFEAEFGYTDCSPEAPCGGDFDGDGYVGECDLAVFSSNFGRTECPLSPAAEWY